MGSKILTHGKFRVLTTTISNSPRNRFTHINSIADANSTYLEPTYFYFQNLKEGFKPKIKRMQNLAQPKTIHISESGLGLLTHNTSEYEMGRLHRPESFVTPHNEA